MIALAASQTQTIAVGPMFAVGDAITPVNATLTIPSVLAEMHMFYRAGTTPGIVTFVPSSTATLSIAGNMTPVASASGMFLLTLTPTLTAWRGSGKLVLRAIETMIPYWDNVVCGSADAISAFMGSTFLPVNTVQVGGATAASATEIASAVWVGATNATAMVGVNIVQISGVSVTATVAMVGTNMVNIGGNAVTTATAQIGVNIVEIAGATVSATTSHFGVNVVGIASTGTALTAVPWNAAWAANVNAEVVDALNVDQYGELGVVAPSVSVPLTYKIGWLYKLSRNKVVTTATGVLVYNDDTTTPGQRFAITDDGTTFTRGEAVVAP